MWKGANEELDKIIDKVKNDRYGLFKSKSEDWGCTYNMNSSISTNAIKPHYTNGDLSNIDSLEEDSEKEESEEESEFEIISNSNGANGVTISGI